MAEHEVFVLRPGVTNPDFWSSDRLPPSEWARVRKRVLERDKHTCQGCGHRAMKRMHVHHLGDSADDTNENLCTICAACHAVLHVGFSLQYSAVEVWASEVPQVEIVRRTRQGVREGRSLAETNKSFILAEGPLPPNSLDYANDLIHQMGDAPRAYLPLPLCAVFVKFITWQLE